MLHVRLGLVWQLVTLLTLSQEAMSASRRKLKEPEKPKEAAVHLNMTYSQIKANMTHIQYKDFANASTGNRRLFVHFASNSDAEGLRALRGFYGAYLRL